MRWSLAALLALSFSVPACRNWLSPQQQQTSERLPIAAPASGPLPATPLTYADVVDHVSPAVVTVRSSRRIRAPQQFPFASDSFLRRFFGIAPGGRGEDSDQIQQALGSGVLVRGDGHILTNHHVIDGAEEIKVDLNDHRTLEAKVIGTDPPSDLAVLKINANNVPPLALGDSDKVRVGDVCLAIGNPLGLGETVTHGIISAKGRRTGLSNGAFEDFLQTDAPINQGNSGGALVNTAGELIGINSQIVSTTGGNIGLGFAIPSNMAKNVMEQLVKSGKVRRGHLGVAVQPVTSALAPSLGMKQVQGVLINAVDPSGPAAKAGLHPGDVVTAIDGKAVNDPNTFRNMVAETTPGTQVTLAVSRNGQEQQIRATLDEAVSQPNTPPQ